MAIARKAYFVIFGAAVRPDGRASGTLARRVQGALAAADGCADRRFIVSGAVGRYGPAEAVVMARLLGDAGVPEAEIIRDEQAYDTLASVLHSARILRRADDMRSLTVCTSTYHVPRCVLLFRLLGLPARGARMPPDRPQLVWRRWLWFCLREIPATPWDALLLSWTRLRGRI